MGSFTQGGMALGQGIGQGIRSYKEKKKRRDHNASKALAIRDQFDEEEKAGTLSAANTKLHKKFQNVEDLGSKQIEALVAEYETGEEIKINSMKRSLLEYQTQTAGAKVASMKGLGDFASKGMPETEAGFEGDAWAVPEYLTRGYLEGDRGQRDIAAGAFPGEHYGDESRAVYEEQPVDPSQFMRRGLEGASEAMRGNPYLEEAGRRRADDDAWLRSGQGSPSNAAATDSAQGYLPEGAVPLWALDDRGEVQYSQKHYDAMFSPKAEEENQRQIDNSYYKGKLEETIKTIADMESKSGTPSRDFAWYNKELENKDMYGRLIESTSQQHTPTDMPTEENPWPRAQAGEEGLNAYTVPDTIADAPPMRAEAEEPARTQQKLVGYETYGDDDTTLIDGIRYAGTSQQQPLDRMATGGRPDTPMGERRGQLIDSLAQYGLTPTDRKQAIEMISEKYPKLKEFATEVITADGEEIGYKVGGTFVKKQKGRVATPQGWRVKSRSVNQSTGEETVVFENPKDQPTYVPTAAKYAEADPELTLKNENATSEGQAKEFNTAFVSAKGIVEDARYLIEMTKDASWFKQRLLDREFKANVNERIAMMKGQMRLLIVGPGAMSEMEQKMLADALPDPSNFFRLDSATIARLEGLEYLSSRKLKLQGESIGLWDYKKIGEGGQSGVGVNAADPADIGI